MSSDLETFRDHCRRMATRAEDRAKAIEIKDDEDLVHAIKLADTADLWAVMADEIDHWMATGFDTDPEEHTEPLWETT